MGQAASQAARRVTASVSRNAPAPRPARVVSRFQPPDDRAQQDFLRKAAGGTDEYKEMSDDLVQFLKDVGPLKRPDNDKGDKDEKGQSTSDGARRRPYWDRQEQETDVQAASTSSLSKDSTRIQQSMRLMEDVEGFDTVRTTSFSHKNVAIDAKDFGLDSIELYRLLSHCKNAAESGLGEEKGVSEYYQQKIQLEGVDADIWNEAEKAEHQQLLQQAAKSLELPVLFKDTDGDYVGVPAERIQEVTHIGLVEMPKDRIKLVLEDLSEMEEAESKLIAV